MPDQSMLILAIAGCTFVLLQTLKKFAPGICGKHAVALNVLFTTVATVIATRPTSWADAISLVVTSSAAAAGIHGTARSFIGKPSDSIGSSPVLTVLCALALGTLASVGLTGCAHQVGTGPVAVAPALPTGAVDQTDATANEVLQTAQAFAAHMSRDEQAGAVSLTRGQLMALEDLNRVINAAAPVEQAYHGCGQQHPLAVAQTCGAAALLAAVQSVSKAFMASESSLAPAPAQ